MPLEGKNAIVTGGASGIGLAACRRLARDGAGIGVWDIDFAGAQRTTAELVASGARAVACNVDVSARAQIDAAVERVHAELQIRRADSFHIHDIFQILNVGQNEINFVRRRGF